MLGEILDNLNNYFVVKDGVHAGKFNISSSVIDVDFLAEGQYYYIKGSIFNDGLHQWGVDRLINESFDGEVWALAIPKSVIDLAEEIETWCENNPRSAYVSEAFGGYSYTRGTSAGTNAPMGWENVFSGQLRRWRKI